MILNMINVLSDKRNRDDDMCLAGFLFEDKYLFVFLNLGLDSTINGVLGTPAPQVQFCSV